MTESREQGGPTTVDLAYRTRRTLQVVSILDGRKQKRTPSLRQAESAFCAILILGVTAGQSPKEGVPMVKITVTIEMSVGAFISVVLIAAAAIYSAIR